jgi:hypothetical protein
MTSVSHGTEVCPQCLQTQLDNMCERERDTQLAVREIISILEDTLVTTKTSRTRLGIIRDLLSDEDDV